MALGTGYPIAAEAFDFEVFQLACTFAASRELAQLSRKHPGVAQLCERFELSEAARRLVSVAAMVRSALDTWSAARRARLDASVGELIPDTSCPAKTCSLKFRESCNKILHAENIDLLDLSRGASGSLQYEVVLEGQKDKHHWRAVLDVLSFVDTASRVA